jgi:maltodextrin utilization protein YvdJ
VLPTFGGINFTFIFLLSFFFIPFALSPPVKNDFPLQQVAQIMSHKPTVDSVKAS